jgi:hypothetical protein
MQAVRHQQQEAHQPPPSINSPFNTHLDVTRQVRLQEQSSTWWRMFLFVQHDFELKRNLTYHRTCLLKKGHHLNPRSYPLRQHSPLDPARRRNLARPVALLLMIRISGDNLTALEAGATFSNILHSSTLHLPKEIAARGQWLIICHYHGGFPSHIAH